MAIFTDQELSEQTSAWKQALLALASGQEYTIGSRKLRRSDLPEVRKTLEFLEAEKSNASGKTRRVQALPRSDTW